jgi:hypothetical protein
MTFAKLPKVSMTRLTDELAKMIAAEAHQQGCSCRTSLRCDYCKTYKRAYKKVRGLMIRLDCTWLHESSEKKT